MTSRLRSCSGCTEGCSMLTCSWRSKMRRALKIQPSEHWQRNSYNTPVKKLELVAGRATKEGAASPLFGSLGISNCNQTREALSGLFHVYGMHSVTNHSQETHRHLTPTPQQQFYSSELHYFFNNFTPRSRYMLMWSRPTAVTCKNESHLLREHWKCPMQLKSFGSENRNVQLF